MALRVQAVFNTFAVMKEEKRLSTPVAITHYEFYSDLDAVKKELELEEENIQCVVGSDSDMIPFGDSQKPGLDTYADNVNTGPLSQ